MAFGISPFGAEAGAQSLLQQQQQAQADARAQALLAIQQQDLQLRQQTAAQDAAIKQATLESINQQRQTEEATAKQGAAEKLATTLINAGGGNAVPIDPQTQQTLTQGGLGPLIQQRQATLGSTNISGPMSLSGGTLRMVANPGSPGGAFLPANPQQAALRTLLNDPSLSPQQKQIISFRLATNSNPPDAFSQPKPTAQPVLTINPRTGQMQQVGMAPAGSHFVDQPAPPQQHFQLVPGTGPDGKPAMYRLDMQTGQSSIVTPNDGGSLTKPTGPGATTETRLQSAKAVTQTGNDIVAMLSDPSVQAQLGPLMSRYNNVADFVGNAPPEWSKLAGMIESYSLANMGVHGMRSSTGAEAIKNTLGQGRHTPQSIIAAVQGLNGFANHLLANNPSFTTGGSGAGGVPGAVQQALQGQKDGRYTLSDGSSWIVKGGAVQGPG